MADVKFNERFTGLVFVTEKSDLPTPSGGIITLLANTAYQFTGTIDLTGDRLVCGENTAIVGLSSENCRIKSTGLTGVALITSNYSLPKRNITIEADVALNLDGDGTTAAIDWFGVNFTNCATIGTIKDYSNVVISDSAFLSSGNLTFDGNIGTIGFGSCLFDTNSGQTAITIAPTCVISRRFRTIYSSFVTGSGETSLNVSASATIPVDSYILDTVNFSGGGTYNTGVQFSDNKASFIKCKGISNSRTIAHYFMNTNATATVISVIATPYKILGTTTAGSVNQRFTHTNNRATYTGAISQTFDITAVITATSGNNQLLGFYITKNGTVITDSESRVTTSGSGRSENVKCQTFVELATGDYIDIVAENHTATTNITATDLSVMIRPTL
jgi:hypothetical protein